MKKNMGSLDRLIRVLAAVVIIILLLTEILTGTLFLVGSIVAVVFLLTSAVRFCPAYVPFGINTCKHADTA